MERKILVLSDSHGDTTKMITAIAKEAPRAVVFLGDKAEDIEELRRSLPSIKFYIVAGNCDEADGCSEFPEKIITDIFGVRFYMTHGHKEKVKTSYMMVITEALNNEAQVALFGHTHETCKNCFSGIEILNPGSIASGNYGVVLINKDSDGELTVETRIGHIFDDFKK